MSDDRPLEEPPEQVGRIEQELNDLKAMVNARLARRPTGDMELSFRATPKDGTLVCNGQAVSRTQYADLFNWASEQGLLGSLFGNGDGSTTFNVPDIRDRFLAAAGTSIGHGATGGQASRTLTVNELPSHSHTASTTVQQHAAHDHSLSVSGSTNSAGSHDHSASTNTAGDHGGHIASSGLVPSGTGADVADNNFANRGGHSHSVDIGTSGSHSHTVSVSGSVGDSAAMSHSASTTVNATGGGQAFDQRPPFIGLQVLVWT